ncbi:hypothetical protein EZV62_001562 [Acer yangbiense]|uniref:Zinc knuckle CX2CX4HX4C domain-containing protein n=1 Tax=Acer yangbiense TaxID=1000413 RepID=A0A5C7IUI9_9ROSI|nr:hypothetical protein EZV62_001562 [Acer yangbiense]
MVAATVEPQALTHPLTKACVESVVPSNLAPKSATLKVTGIAEDEVEKVIKRIANMKRQVINIAEFLVQISNIPILCMTREIGRVLGGIIGEVREVDAGPSRDCLGKFLRVRVAIEIDKPLSRFLRVDVLSDSEETVMPIQYERLPNFCFRFGLLGHTARECPDIGKEGPLKGIVFSYGS